MAITPPVLTRACAQWPSANVRGVPSASLSGNTGKLTATVPGERFVQVVTPILAEVGSFPHAPLDWAGWRSGPKKQTGRLLKVECGECGLVVRQTRKWFEEVGPAHCPEHGGCKSQCGMIWRRRNRHPSAGRG
jgi:hypothetical protein